MTTKIFALIDPRNGETKFVGRCSTVSKRLQVLMGLARGDKQDDPVIMWLRELLPGGPKVKLLEEALERPYRTLRRWAEKYKAQGAVLLNEPKPPKRQSNYKIVWTPELKAQLGTVSDARIAEQVGVSARIIAWHRTRMGIPPSNDRSRRIAATKKRGR